MGNDCSIKLAKINLKSCIYNMISILYIQVSRGQRMKIHQIYVSVGLVFFPIFYISVFPNFPSGVDIIFIFVFCTFD